MKKTLNFHLANYGVWVICFAFYAAILSPDSAFAYISPDLTVIACNGVPGDAPENTFAAFEQAIQFGADGIKVDVRKTKDGKLILMKDPTIDRTTDGKGYVESLLYDEIQLYDAGSWMDKKFKGQRVPLLSNVLKFVKANNITIILDVKQQGVEDHILSLIKEFDVEKQVYFWGSLWGFSGLEYELPGKSLVFIAPENLTQEAVKRSHTENKLVVTTLLECDDRENLKENLTKGVDIVLIDYPHIIKEILQRGENPDVIKWKSAQRPVLNLLKNDIRTLTNIISDSGADESRMAALSLATHPPTVAVPPLVKLSKSRNVVARRNATWALGFVKDKRSVETLTRRLDDKDTDVRREAVLGLKRQSDRSTVPELIKKLLHDEDAGVRFDAARTLGYIEDQRAVYPLITALKNDPDWGVRDACVCALGKIKSVKAVDALGTILVADTFCSEACWVREMAARALAKIGKPSIETLIAALRDNEKCTRRRASWALIRIGQPAASSVASTLRDTNYLVRRRAAYILGWIEDDDTLYPLLRAMKDEEPAVRQTAAWALGRLGDPRAKGALKVAANDKDSQVKASAREAAARLKLD